jgi:hypothetical protein
MTPTLAVTVSFSYLVLVGVAAMASLVLAAYLVAGLFGGGRGPRP